MQPSPFEQMQASMSKILEIRYSDLELERELCTLLLETAERERYTYGIAFAHTYLGDYYIAQNDSAQCGEELRIAKELCAQNGYYDLLLRIYNFLGICYTTLSDEQSALQQYMKALDLSEIHPEPAIRCAVLNNIASDFAARRDFAEATKYFLQAMLILPQCESEHSYYYIQLRLYTNLADCFAHQGKLEEAKSYLTLCEQVNATGFDVWALLLDRSWCRYWAAKNDREQARMYAEQLLRKKPEAQQDKFFIFEILFDICEAMISLGDADCSEQILNCLGSIDTGDTPDWVRQIQHLKVSFCEAFRGRDELYNAYQEYYRAVSSAEEQVNRVRADGMRAALHLHTALQEKDAAVEGMRKMEGDAHLDELTGLYNRRYFNKLSSKASARTDVSRISIIMLDVDYFKEYNDTYGHLAGDQVLKRVAALIRSHADACSTPARYGGDEFICLCLDKTDKEIEACISSLRKALAALNIEHSASRCAPRVTLSAGYCNVSFQPHISIGLLIEKADQALYRAKNAGRDGWSK